MSTPVYTLTAESASDYLRKQGWISQDERVEVKEITSGISSTVIRVMGAQRGWIVKQPLSRMRGHPDWMVSMDRQTREVECYEALRMLLPPGSTPDLLRRDISNHVAVFAAMPKESANWHERIVTGPVEVEVAANAGSLLGTMHRQSYGDETLSQKFGDKTFFHELCLDPFYGPIAEIHPRLAEKIGSHAASLATSSICLVHGDYCPENLIVVEDRLVVVDMEGGHFGHPAFDLGWMLAHLTIETFCLSSAREEGLAMTLSFWNAYINSASFETESWHALSSLPHTGCLLLSCLDGKSQGRLLPDERYRGRIRSIAASLISREIPSMRVFLDIMLKAL